MGCIQPRRRQWFGITSRTSAGSGTVPIHWSFTSTRQHATTALCCCGTLISTALWVTLSSNSHIVAAPFPWYIHNCTHVLANTQILVAVFNFLQCWLWTIRWKRGYLSATYKKLHICFWLFLFLIWLLFLWQWCVLSSRLISKSDTLSTSC